MILKVLVRPYELGLMFRDEMFVEVLPPGTHRYWNLRGKLRAEVVSQRAPALFHAQLDLMLEHPLLKEKLVVLDLADHERGLVWIDGRFSTVLTPGRHAFFTGFRKIRTEVVDTRTVKFSHPEREAIITGNNAMYFELQDVAADHVAILTLDGKPGGTLEPGRYAFWKNRANVKLTRLDLREQLIEVPGQDVLTADRLTMRVTAVGIYRVVDPLRVVSNSSDAAQALYREVQLAIRAAVGTRTLDALLTEKDALGANLTAVVAPLA
ncbi:MAG: SPFH domain-containing protein, partial [Gemmataceae bacterium]